MNIRQKIEAISRIANEFDKNCDWQDVYILLKEYDIKILGGSPDDWDHDRRAYVKTALKDVTDEDIISIANAYEIHIPSMTALTSSPPKDWKNNDAFRLFISHLAIHKDKAKRLKETLAPHHVAAFVAHEDIEPAKEWQKEIERALFTMDAMLAVHTKGFSESIWTQQEIGFALGRGVKVISLRMDEDPKGFISKDQAILRNRRDAESVSSDIVSILTNDATTKSRMQEVFANHEKVSDSKYSLDNLDEDIPF